MALTQDGSLLTYLKGKHKFRAL